MSENNLILFGLITFAELGFKDSFPYHQIDFKYSSVTSTLSFQAEDKQTKTGHCLHLLVPIL